MVDVTHKITTHRKAVAQAIVRVSSEYAIEAIRKKEVPKGDVFEMARAAAMFAAKRTSDIIPYCHPLPIEYATVRYEINELTIYIEVEAMHAASVAALTIYDMLKPIDKEIVIEQIKLLRKEGGKSDFILKSKKEISAAVIICSDAVFQGQKGDEAGKTEGIRSTYSRL
jgi:molybdenum cofactor biosynthesis protein MoaC